MTDFFVAGLEIGAIVVVFDFESVDADDRLPKIRPSSSSSSSSDANKDDLTTFLGTTFLVAKSVARHVTEDILQVRALGLGIDVIVFRLRERCVVRFL